MKWISVMVFGCSAALAAPIHSQEALRVTVDPSRRYQTIEHFGASAAWWAQALGEWKSSDRDRSLDLLFDPHKGIGLTLVRYNIGGGKADSGIADPWRSAAAPVDTPSGWDWSPDQAAVAMVDGAVARGASVILFANSPPKGLTVTGMPTGRGPETNLKPGAEGAFARYLADCTASLGRRWPVVAVSPINEPQWDWQPSKGQEGCFYTPEEALRLVAAVVAEFRARGLAVPVSAFDSAEWSMARNRAFVEALASEPGLWSSLTPYAVHSYWSDVFDKAELAEFLAARLPKLGVWQTEWTEMRPGRDEGMDAALTLAQVVHEDLTTGGVSSWQYWIAVSKYDYADGLLYADEAGQTVTATKKLWALGNWSRFVRPGAVRLEVALEEGLASAFENRDGSRVVVLVNPTEEPSAPVAVVGWDGAQRWETSATRDLEALGAVNGALVLPPRSLTTLVLEPSRK